MNANSHPATKLTPFPPLRACNWREFLLWLCRRRQRLRVVGYSMLPTLRPNDEVLVQPVNSLRRSLQVGDIIVTRSPEEETLKIIKRLRAINDQKEYWIEGDNASESRDSRQFGWISLNQIDGCVTCLF